MKAKEEKKEYKTIRVSADALSVAQKVKAKYGTSIIRFFDEAAELAKKKFKIK